MASRRAGAGRAGPAHAACGRPWAAATAGAPGGRPAAGPRRRGRGPSASAPAPAAVSDPAGAGVEPAGDALSALARVALLSESLPYIQRFRGKVVVVKYGGAAMKDPALKALVVKDIVLLACLGIKTVLVHGGGPEINLWLERLQIESKVRQHEQ